MSDLTMSELIALAIAKGYSDEQIYKKLLEANFPVPEEALESFKATHPKMEAATGDFGVEGSDQDLFWFEENGRKEGRAARAAIRKLGVEELSKMRQEDREHEIRKCARKETGIKVSERGGTRHRRFNGARHALHRATSRDDRQDLFWRTKQSLVEQE